MDLEKASIAHATELNKGIIQVGKDLSISLLIGFGIIAIAIKNKK